MHILARHYYDEFLATPQLVRFDFAEGDNGREPTLLLKGSTVLLKYVILGASMRLRIALLQGRLLYGLDISDDSTKPVVVWSAMEREEERLALLGIAEGEELQIFIFNELAVNVAWSSSSIKAHHELAEMVNNAQLGGVDYECIKEEAAAMFDRALGGNGGGEEWVLIPIQNRQNWKAVKNFYITNQINSCPVHIFDSDEGGQQENLAVWLTDNLHPRGAYASPQIPKGSGGLRELTDVMLTHEFGAFVVESKALTILGRDSIPNRDRLARNVAGHIKKASSQLRGAIRELKRGRPVQSAAGELIAVEREFPIHAIVLIPEFDLVDERENFGIEAIRSFTSDTGGFLHILDIAELLRIVQASEAIAERGDKTTPMMAFDYYLMERWKYCVEAETLLIHVLLRFEDE